MFVQINTDNQIESDRERNERLEEQIRQRLAALRGAPHPCRGPRLRRERPRKGGADLKCTLEARANGIQPVAVSEHGPTRRPRGDGGGQDGGARSIIRSASSATARGIDAGIARAAPARHEQPR